MLKGVVPISLFLLANGTVLCKAAIDLGVQLSTVGTAVDSQKKSNSTVSVLF